VLIAKGKSKGMLRGFTEESDCDRIKVAWK